MPCLQCGRGLHNFCLNADCAVCHPVESEEVDENESDGDDEYSHSRRKRSGARGGGKRDDSLKDQQSTGRKRAAVRYPLNRDASCEWRGLLFAGGGERPIVGCVNGFQQARHHGPDKNTLNNDEGNVHRICHTCHNRWHARNDEEYIWGSIYRPHDSITVATPEEIWTSEQSWMGKKLKKVVD